MEGKQAPGTTTGRLFTTLKKTLQMTQMVHICRTHPLSNSLASTCVKLEGYGLLVGLAIY